MRQGGAIAEPIITVNLVGGIVIGVLESGMDISEAMNTYALPTIGDGLAAQLPARIMAMASGIIVTRSNVSADIGSIASLQLTAGSVAIASALVPGMKKLPLVLIGAMRIFDAQRPKLHMTKGAARAGVAHKTKWRWCRTKPRGS